MKTRISRPALRSSSAICRPVVAAALMLLAGGLVAPVSLSAHELYLEARSTSGGGPDEGHRVLLELRLGHGRDGEPVPRLPSSFRSLRSYGLDGSSREIPGAWQVHPAGFLPRWQGEPLLMVYRSLPIPHRLSAARFDRYLVEEGLDAVRLERRRGGPDQEGRERYVRCAATLLQAELPASPARGASRIERLSAQDGACRLRLWLKAASLTPGQMVAKVTFDGRPLAGALVRHSLLYPSDSGQPPRERTFEQRTRSDGTVALATLDLAEIARHRFHVVHAIPETQPEHAQSFDWRTFWTSLTLDVDPRRRASTTDLGPTSPPAESSVLDLE